jgi:hypothetical protein
VESPREPTFLRIVVAPWADIFIDGVAKGTTPLPRLEIEPGVHDVELRHPGYEPFHRKVSLPAGANQTLRVDLATDGVPKR